MDFIDQLKVHAAEEGYILNDIQLHRFNSFYRMVVEKNKYMNLTSIVEEEEFIYKHILDSLSASRLVLFNNISKCIDIGTGAGFPGIPLKIMYPDIEFVLLDSLKKRITFLEEVIEELELDKVQAIHGRAEDLARNVDYRQQFDLCVSRAVAALPVLSEYCIPFVKKGGCFISYKSKKGLEEIQTSERCLKILGSEVEKVEEFNLSDIAEERVLILIRKNKNTHAIYPRKAGIPSKKPL